MAGRDDQSIEQCIHDFLAKLAENQTQTKPAPKSIPTEVLQDMVANSAIIEYYNQGAEVRYAITSGGISLLSRLSESLRG